MRNTKNIVANTLNYTGIVTLSQYVGSKKTRLARAHNTGGNSLFEFLADCLMGDFTLAQANRPIKIMLLSRNQNADGSVDYTALVPGFIFLRTPPEKVLDTADITQSVVRYSFIATKEQLAEVPNFDNLGIGLYAANTPENDLDNFAAYCEIDISRKDLIDTALVIDWELIISNNTSSIY